MRLDRILGECLPLPARTTALGHNERLEEVDVDTPETDVVATQQ